MDDNKQQMKVEVPARLMEVAVNRMLHVLQVELRLNQVEAVFALRESAAHLEKIHGIQFIGMDNGGKVAHVVHLVKPEPPKADA